MAKDRNSRSIIWFIGFGAFIWTDTVRQNVEFHGNSLRMCKSILDANNASLRYIGKQDERDKRQSANWAKYEKCQKDAEAFLDREMETAKSGIPLLLAIDVGTVLVGWFVVWMFVCITRWVRRGFALRGGKSSPEDIADSKNRAGHTACASCKFVNQRGQRLKASQTAPGSSLSTRRFTSLGLGDERTDAGVKRCLLYAQKRTSQKRENMSA